MPLNILETEVKNVWEITVDLIKHGNIVRKITKEKIYVRKIT